ncbi:MAG: DUF362 domain-containing protein [Anaerolineae bacterium]|nr:DUF362 domain-containing protein [Anaerolineae bacterium]
MRTDRTDYKVRAVHCDHRSEDEAVYEALKRATAPLTEAWAELKAAGTIAIKFNQDYDPDRMPHFKGMRQQLVSDKVARAVLRLLREETSAGIFCVDTTVFHRHEAERGKGYSTQLAPVLKAFEVDYVDADEPPHGVYDVPGGGQMFTRYVMPERVMEADALVDVQKIKNHAFMGVTLTLKNLFGLMVQLPHNKPRHYYHHLVRMPYMLADLGQLYNPTLNIIDGLVGQAGMEWGNGEGLGRVVDALIAGDHAVATDTVGMHLMGLDPMSDWLAEPFHRDRNPLLVAAEGGYGTVDLNAIDWESEVDPQPEGTFYAIMTDALETNISWRRTMCEQALYYRDHIRDFAGKYAGEYILLQDNEVKWHDPDGHIRVSRRQLAGENKDHAMYFKFVDPEEKEGEHYAVYESALAHLRTLDRVCKIDRPPAVVKSWADYR